jgi:hypothetical protein
MQTDPRSPAARVCCSNQLAMFSGWSGRPSGSGEHVPVVAVPSSDGLAVLSLELALGVQRRKRDGVESEAAPAPLGLGRRVMDLVINNHPGNERGDGGMVEVDVDPAQPGELAAAHASGGDQQPQGVQAVASDVLEEAAQLCW